MQTAQLPSPWMHESFENKRKISIIDGKHDLSPGPLMLQDMANPAAAFEVFLDRSVTCLLGTTTVDEFEPCGYKGYMDMQERIVEIWPHLTMKSVVTVLVYHRELNMEDHLQDNEGLSQRR